ncbi:alanine racemase [Desulfobaculum bizertense]|uniref:alanine racemase n=1 Tax=Desulfobaculum bizertense TaxID=376490 RepID=UPI001F418366|nr:alanine racemase [Desulfobaculum bizertense]UIJ39079.1 alanine racemase [Desulfobaculum bizertense]
MTIPFNHLEAIIHPDRIVQNWRKLEQIGGKAYAVIKADAYGHGVLKVTEALERAHAHTICAGSVEEAVAIRKNGFSGRIMSLLGPQLDQDYALCATFQIIPFVGQVPQLRRLDASAAAAGLRQPVALKFDTGMNRLGFVPEQVASVLPEIQSCSHVDVCMVCSHLAVADDSSEQNFTHKQGQRFSTVVNYLRDAGLQFEASLSSSPGLLAHPELRFDAQRPGISLYGGNPFWGTENEALGEGFVPAMELRSRVYQVHPLKKGETVSYGRTFKAEHDMQIAIVGGGYADNILRCLSNRTLVTIHEKRARLLGRVCMQMAAVDVSHISGVQPGDDVWFLGGPGENPVRVEEIADCCGTISYEVLCLFGQNQRRFA